MTGGKVGGSRGGAEGADPVLHDDPLAELLRELLRDEAGGNVRRPAGGEPDDDRDDAARIVDGLSKRAGALGAQAEYECGDSHGNLPILNRLNGSNPPDTHRASWLDLSSLGPRSCPVHIEHTLAILVRWTR